MWYELAHAHAFSLSLCLWYSLSCDLVLARVLLFSQCFFSFTLFEPLFFLGSFSIALGFSPPSPPPPTFLFDTQKLIQTRTPRATLTNMHADINTCNTLADTKEALFDWNPNQSVSGCSVWLLACRFKWHINIYVSPVWYRRTTIHRRTHFFSVSQDPFFSLSSCT